MADFEALAAECRAAAFRESLSATDVWAVAAGELRGQLRQLRAAFSVSVANSVDQRAGGESAAYSAVGGAVDELDDEDDGLGYTLRVDRSQLPGLASAGDLAPRSVVVSNAGAVEGALQGATSALRFLRNACAGSSDNQDASRAAGCLQLAHDVVLGCCEWVDVEDEDTEEAVVLLAQVALQFSVNCVTGNEASQAAVWELFFPDHFHKILVECQEHRKVCAFTAALILNCVIASGGDLVNNGLALSPVDDTAPDATPTPATRRTDLVCARNLVITLLQRCMPKPVAASSAAEINSPVSTDPAFEWVCLLFRALFRAGHARNLYNAVGAHMLSRLWSRVTPEQLILLRMFSLWVDHISETQRTPAVGEGVDISEARALVATFEFVQTTWAFLINSDDEDRPDDVEPVRKLMWIELENESKLLLLDMLGELTVSSRHQLTASNEDACHELLSSVLGELRRVWQLRQTNPKPTAQAKSGSGSDPGDQQQAERINEPAGYRSRLIRVAGNLCFRNTARQDLVREEGFIPLVLAHCNIDEYNPLIREWALVALRNLCEGNEANQQYIDAMRPQNKDGAAPGGESEQSK